VAIIKINLRMIRSLKSAGSRIGRLLAISTILVFLVAMTLSCNQPPRVRPVADQEHIERLIHSLPPDSEMRAELERGDRGYGTRYPWMHLMRTLGVRRAKVLTEFVWFFGPRLVQIQRVTFFKTYDSNCSQITDGEELRRIDAAGLTQALSDFAIAETSKSDWTHFEHRPHAVHGVSLIDVGDDEWLPMPNPVLVPRQTLDPLEKIMIDGNVTVLKATLASQHYSQDKLDFALMDASGHSGYACSIKPLVRAGANPNVTDNDGFTPLMLAAYAGVNENLTVLLDVGANTKRQNVFGQTALAVAQSRGYWKTSSALKEYIDSH